MIGLIFGDTDFPNKILKIIKKRKIKYLIIDLSKSKKFKKDSRSYSVSIGQFGKIIKILNENNYNVEDCIVILRTFLSKAKRIYKLAIELEKNHDIYKTINTAKPPIFWKDKEIVKVQLKKWKSKKIKALINKINDVELKIKKNYTNSVLIVTNFILEESLFEASN